MSYNEETDKQTNKKAYKIVPFLCGIIWCHLYITSATILRLGKIDR